MVRKPLLTLALAAAVVVAPASQPPVGAAGRQIVDLGPNMHARAVNSLGVVVGEAYGPPLAIFRWHQGQMELLPVGVVDFPVAVNRTGVMAAWDLWEGSFHYDNGVVTDLGSLSDPPAQTRATDIDDRGVIVGRAGAGDDTHAFVWRNGTIRDLGTLGGRHSFAVATNGKGQILGSSETRTGRSHVVIWQDGRVKDLGRLAPNGAGPKDINDAGQIVGGLPTADGYEYRGFVWANGRLTVLPPLPGHATSWATAINNQGVIVGGSGPDASGRHHAVLWSNGKPRALPELDDIFSEAVDIGDDGTIAGNAHHPDGSWHAVVWTR